MSPKKTREQFIKESKEKHGNKYAYDKVEYINAYTHIIIICNIHNEFKQTPINHLSGHGCAKCAYLNKKNKYIYEKVNYVSTHAKVIIICKNHGDFKQNPNHHLSGKGCPRRVHKAETKCVEHLENLSCVKFTKCRPKFLNGMELDGYNEELRLAIEYNGRQHYQYDNFFHNNKKEFEEQKERDSIKKKICTDNNIYLMVIPYWTKDVENFIRYEYSKYEFLNILRN